MTALRARDEGRIVLHPRFPSSFLSTRRDLIVYLPPGYRELDWRYPVLYLQDGQNLFDPATAFGGQDWRADVTADDLIRAGEIRPIIIVGVYNTGVRRISEYTPTRDRRLRKGGKADRHAEMLAREIKPFIDHEYQTLKAAAFTAVGGSSLGGLAALIAGLEYPRVFGNLAVMSPSVWWDARAILGIVRGWRGRVRPKVWLDCGTAEGDDAAAVVNDLRELRQAMHAKGWRDGEDLSYCEVESAGHNEAAWGARFGRVLKFLFGK
ncbi:MAG TPA: alpha/beta hydrolase-fold protein [Bryobacteraceae bacterium]|nr:alpha/beta hydrolase-fold protein [Bryobacteraceae bacterium]